MKLQFNSNFLYQNSLLSCLACAEISKTPLELESHDEGIEMIQMILCRRDYSRDS